ncbi:MAG: hypothetical protein IPL76_09115 [Gemmatimonadetes bacterium]|nr:hypothetical protein [Gemmatimonadota bacterium]
MATPAVPMARPIGLAPPGAGRSLPVTGQVIPSFPLVGSHFALGFGWALAGAVGLVWLAPQLATGSFLDPRVLALTHLCTLGFLTTVITGVLYQVFPAMLGIGERSRPVAWAALGLHALGTALLACGLLLGQRSLQSAGWSVLFVAVFGTAWNLLPQRRRAPRNRQLGLYVSYAHIGFGCAMLVAGVRIGDALGWWTTPRLGLISAHLHLGLAGFVTMTAFGLGSRMIPMFYGSPTPIPARLDTWMPRLLGTAVLVYATGAVLGAAPLAWAGTTLMATAGALFCWLGLGWFRTRARRALDPATGLLTLALASLAAAIPLGLTAAALGPRRPGVLVAYVLALLLGWAGALVLGVSFRVLPTLTWHHRFATRMGRPGTPAMPAMLHRGLGITAAVAGALGLLVLVPGVAAGSAPAARAGAALFTLAITATILHHLRMLLIGRARPAASGTLP